MNFRPILLAACAAAAVALFASAPATACTAPAPGVHRAMQPTRDATGIPRNTEIRLRFKGYNDEGYIDAMANPSLRDAQGQPVLTGVEKRVDHQGTVFILRPAAPLAAEASYTVLDDLGTAEDFAPFMRGIPQHGQAVAGSFTTGSQLDETAPTFSGLTGFSSSWDECDNGACCGPYAGYRIGLLWEPATDDQNANDLTYNVYRQLDPSGKQVPPVDKVLVGSFLVTTTGAVGTPYLAWASTLGSLEDGAYQVCAIDLAGHENCGAGAKVFAQPVAPQPDADPDAADTTSDDTTLPQDATQNDGIGGADATTDATTTTDGGGSGCSAGRTGTTRVGIGWLLLGLAAITFGRRGRKVTAGLVS